MQIKKNTLIFLLVLSLMVGMIGTVAVVKSGILGSIVLTNDEYEILENYASKYQKLDELLSFVKNNYYIDVDESDLIEGAYQGLVSGLGDPYSTYVSASEYEEYIESVLGTSVYYGVGITFLTAGDENGFLITNVNTKGPAYAAGVRKGGYICKVDGADIRGIQGDTLSDIIRGEEGTTVVVSIMYGDEIKDYSIVRQAIAQESVTYEYVEASNGEKIGVITVSQFISSTYSEFMTALEDVEANADYMVLDLRDNPGGLVDSSIRIADELMGEGVIIRIENVHGFSSEYTSDADRTSLSYVVLTNGNSASAAEILTVGIKENGDAKIVGTKTYGKGIIQNTVSFTDGSAVKYTEYQYVSAGGNAIHEVGITPDYNVELTEDCYNEKGILENDIQLKKAIEVLVGE